MTKQDYTDVLLEDLNSKFDTILEIVSPLVVLPNKIEALQNDVAELKADIKIVKAVVTDHGMQSNNHEIRIAALEAA